jgi:hypothetical protein
MSEKVFIFSRQNSAARACLEPPRRSAKVFGICKRTKRASSQKFLKDSQCEGGIHKLALFTTLSHAGEVETSVRSTLELMISDSQLEVALVCLMPPSSESACCESTLLPSESESESEVKVLSKRIKTWDAKF